MQQESQSVHPKIPYWAQRRGAERKEQHYAPGQPRQHKQPQLSLGAVQGEKEDGASGQQAIDQVQQTGGSGEPQPEHPE